MKSYLTVIFKNIIKFNNIYGMNITNNIQIIFLFINNKITIKIFSFLFTKMLSFISYKTYIFDIPKN